ncbi:MAG: class I SAM-dependent methyltransferase [Desulfuromonadales bacterium]|nr:class I SAM-dependent methyltransferase [Desulfuromonadales bacterium]NIR33957.1 class I SAM-dependent methyltransferase [Desulfuromonadales bacterium]NIS41505.1 class I SAM-dependent methyltransferase [Desulfuromonadales bacterium]
MTTNYSPAVNTARDYYNSDDADNFYFTIWGGEDIHIGLYQTPEEDIFAASRRTVERMGSFLEGLDENSRVLDIGAGYGGAARYLAKNFGCKVVALNLSEKENERDRQMNREQGLDQLIEVVDGSFEDIPYDDESFDVVWSQDAILHSGERAKVVEEVARVLKPGGRFIFTDPMQTDDCPEGVLQPILDRIHLETLGSPGFYRDMAEKVGLEEERFEEHHEQLPRHYARVLKETERVEKDLSQTVSQAYIERMKKGLQHWVDGGNNGYLAWGIFCFRKK